MRDSSYPQLVAYLLAILLRHDRGIRAVGPPATRQEWGIGRIGDYLRGIGREVLEEGSETELWALLRASVALLPSRREGGLVAARSTLGSAPRVIDDQNIPAPPKPDTYRHLQLKAGGEGALAGRLNTATGAWVPLAAGLGLKTTHVGGALLATGRPPRGRGEILKISIAST